MTIESLSRNKELFQRKYKLDEVDAALVAIITNAYMALGSNAKKVVRLSMNRYPVVARGKP